MHLTYSFAGQIRPDDHRRSSLSRTSLGRAFENKKKPGNIKVIGNSVSASSISDLPCIHFTSVEKIIPEIVIGE